MEMHVLWLSVLFQDLLELVLGLRLKNLGIFEQGHPRRGCSVPKVFNFKGDISTFN